MLRLFSRAPSRPAQAAAPEPVAGHEPANTVLEEFRSDWSDLSGLQVLDGELVATTADDTHAPMGGVLARVRHALGVDAVFVSQMLGGRRVVRHSAHEAEAACDPLEETYCLRLIADRTAQGTAVAVPVVGATGRVYGTVASATAHADAHADAPLRSVARLIAAALDQQESGAHAHAC